jgi:secreted PhoX family phosphatase
MTCLSWLIALLLGPAHAGELSPRASFAAVPVPETTAGKRAVQLSPLVVWNGRSVPLRYTPLFEVGVPVGESRRFAHLYDADGQPIIGADGEPRLCNGLDGATLLEVEGQVYSVVHAECTPGALQLSLLSQDKDSGMLSAVATSQVDLKAVGGGNSFCAAEATAWGTHLAAEEFEADAGKLLSDGTISDNHAYYNNMVRYWGSLEGVSPYKLGWIDELQIEDGQGTISKRYALGRFSHEQARVMPDQRTVYLTDDGTNGGFFVFVADAPGDLRAGTLYISRWTQKEAERFTLSWISLGHASETQISAAMDKPPTFDQLFQTKQSERCSEGFRRIRTAHEQRCIRVRPGQELLASRLESRRMGALLGGTTELRKWEGMAVDPAGRRLYAAVSSVGRGMLGGDAEWDLKSADHIRMEANPCGMVMGLDVASEPVRDTEGQTIESPWIVDTAAAVVSGRPVAASSPDVGVGCHIDGIANPDNLAFMPEARTLLIAEDTHAHENNVLWGWDPDSRELRRILTAPIGAEVAGLNWFPDIGGFGYLTLTIQYSDADWRGPEDPEEIRMSTSGVIGPFPGPVSVR